MQQIVGAKLASVLQRQIQAGHDTNTAVKRVAAEWYPGDPVAHDTQSQAGSKSIKRYADRAEEKFHRVFYIQILPDLKRRKRLGLTIIHNDRYFHLSECVLKLENGQLVEHSTAHLLS